MISLSEKVLALRAQGIDIMAGLSGELSALLDTSAQLSASLQGLSQSVDRADSAVSLQSVAARIASLQDLLQLWNTRLDDSRVRASFSTVDFALQDLRKIAVRFRMIAMQAQIEVTAESESDNSKFTDDLRATPADISVCVGALKDSTQRVQRAHNAAFTECSKAATEVATIAGVMASAMAAIEGDRTAVTKAKTDVSDVIERFQQDTRKHSVSIISSFQFSDFFAQRMEHIAQLACQPASRAQACDAMAKAQLLAVISDGQEIVRSIHAALEQMWSLQSAFTAAYGDHEQNVLRLIEGQKAALESVMTHREDALGAIEKAVASTTSIHMAVEDAQKRFHLLNGLSGVIDMAAINARLRSNRMVYAQKTMAVLSSAVLETAQESREVITQCAAALHLIAVTHDAQESAKLQVDVQQFRQDYDACSNGMVVAMDALAQLSQLRANVMASLSQLNKSLGASRLVADRLAMVLQSLSDLAQDVPDAPPNLEWPDLSDIFDIYTMEDERAVHRAMLGLAISAAALPPPPEQALDSVFF